MQVLPSVYPLLTIILAVSPQKNHIYWTLLDSPIKLGSDVHLLCNITCCVNNATSHAIWSTENGVQKSLSSNMLSTNYEKYDILTSRDGCRLVIKNFSLEDSNINYTCAYNFEQFSKNLTLNKESFEYQPRENEMSVSDNIINGDLMVLANITKSFPMPVCTATFNGENITSSLQTDTTRNGIFYTTQLTIQLPVRFGTFQFQCVIGAMAHRIKEIKIYNLSTSTIREENELMIVAVVLGILLFGLSVYVVLKWFHQQPPCRRNEVLVLTDIKEIKTEDEQDDDFATDHGDMPLLRPNRRENNELAPKVKFSEAKKEEYRHRMKIIRQRLERKRCYTT